MNNSDFTTQLADIEIPAPLHATADFTWLGIGLIIAALAIGFIVLRRKKASNTPPTLALKKLDDLEQQWQQGTLDTRQVAYQLATLLRLGLGLKQLTHEHIATLYDKKQANTLNLLKTLRYEKNHASAISKHTFEHVRQWLNDAKRSRT